MKKRLMSIFVFTAIVGLTTACKDKQEESSTTETPIEETTTSVNEGEEEPTAIVDEAVVEGEEDYYDPTVYPTSFKFKHDLIMTGEYHEGEIVDNVSSKSWVGLIKETDGTYSVHKVNPTTKLIHDVVLDEAGQMTGVKVSAKSVGEVVFMTNEGVLTQGSNLETVNLPKTIYPGESKDFIFKGKTYTLFAKGEKGAAYTYQNEEGEEVQGYEIKKYSLFLKVKGQDKVIALLDLSSLEEATPTIDFVGDLNGDGNIDFLINTTYNYNMSRYTLYLSEGKSGAVTVKPVAALVNLGC